MIKRAIILVAVFVSGFAFCAEVEWSQRLEGDQINGGGLIIQDGDFVDLISGNPNFIDVKAFGYVRLGLNDRISMDYYDNGSAPQVIEVILSIEPFDNTGSPMPVFTTTLRMNYSVYSETNLLDGTDFRMTDIHKFKVTVMDIIIDGVSNPFAIKNYVYLQAGFSAERYYEMDSQSTPIIRSQMVFYHPSSGNVNIESSSNSTSPQTDEIYLNWEYVDGAEYYDLEWTWVDNYSGVGFTTIMPANSPMSEVDFKINSTRIRTSDQFYRIPQIFSKGYLIFRVRGVGRWLDDPSQDKYGKWSSGMNAQNVSDWDFVKITEEHEKDKNWQYQTTYAEDGKKKEVIQYFDGSLRGRQTVTRINSDNQSVVGESIYDVEGRAVVQILPVPQKNPAMKYYPSLNENTLGNPYSHQDFDWEDSTIIVCEVDEAAPLETGAADYYSVNGYNSATDQDWQKYVPESNGYPFTQVEYTPDNTGRIRNQSGVGETHKIGSGRETKYYYLQPSQEELDRLFGYTVGYKMHYKKNLVVDANQQVSVSYMDPQGRVIATALAGDNSTSYLSLDSEQNGNHGVAYTDLLGKQNDSDVDTEVDDNQLFSTGNFGALEDGLEMGTQLGVVDDGTYYNFTYSVLPDVYEEYCDTLGVKYPYVYDLKLSLRDDCGNEFFSVTDSLIGIEQIGASTNSAMQVLQDTFLLNQGSYTLYKSLTVNKEALENYKAHYLSGANLCLLDSASFVPEPDTIPCPISCDACMENLGLSLQEFKENWALDSLGHDSLGIAPLASVLLGSDAYYDIIYQQRMEDCLASCTPTFSCDVYRKLLLGDVSPGGQYAGMNIGNSTSVFTTGYWRGNHFITDSVNYTDEFGATVLIEGYIDSSTTYLPNIGYEFQTSPNGQTPVMVEPWRLKRDDFIQLFQPSWAEALIEFHPEYELYLYTEELCSEEYGVATIPSGSKDLSSNYLDFILTDILTDYDQLGVNPENIDFLASLPGSTPFSASQTNHPIYSQDPFFQQTYSVHGAYSALKVNLMLEALNQDYDGTGMPMIKYAIKSALYGNDLTMGVPTEEWSDVAGLLPEQRDSVWEKYKFYYLSYKGQIDQLLMDLYGFNLPTPIFNGCIGSDGLSAGILVGFVESNYFFTTILPTFTSIWFTSFPSNIPYTLCGPEYDDKIIRITRMDALYDPSLTPLEIIEGLSLDADAALLSQTGLCPLTNDIEVLLNQMGQDGQLVSATGISQAQIPSFVPDLYEAFSGTPITAATSNMILQGIPSASGLTIYFSGATGMTSSAELVLSNPTNNTGSLSWLNYGSWNVYSIDQSYVVPGGLNNETQLIIKAGITPAMAKEYLVSYTITGVPIDFNDCAYLNNLSDANCTKEEDLEADLLNVLQAQVLNGTLTSSVNITSAPYFQNSTLEAILGVSTSVFWGPQNANGAFSISNGVNALTFDLTSSFPTNNFVCIGLDLQIDNSVSYIGNVTITLVDNQGTLSTLTGTCVYSQGDNAPIQLVLDCPCEEEQVIGISSEIENLINSLVQINNPVGLEISDLTSTEDLFNGQSPIISPFHKGYTFKKYCLEYSTHWSAGTSENSPAPCLKLKICNKKLSGNERISSVSNLTFDPTSMTFTCDVLLTNGLSFQNVTGSISCITIPPCEACPIVLQSPVSCTDAYDLYKAKMDDLFNVPAMIDTTEVAIYQQEHLIEEEIFCGSKYAYLLDAYILYLNSVDSTGINQQNYLAINEFGATPIGYSSALLTPVINAYASSSESNPTSQNYTTWNLFAFDYFESANPPICPASMGDPYINIPEMVETPCAQWEGNVDIVNTSNQTEIYLEQMGNAFVQAYVEGAMSSVVENYKESHEDKEYHYTLYYYDRAGNLVQTVPPNGVDRFEFNALGNPISYAGSTISATYDQIGSFRDTMPEVTTLTYSGISGNLAPEHTYETNYRYNSLNQLVYQRTPDGGVSRFAYDALGRLVLSQNAKQRQVHQFSYTVYDFLGRVVEVGELTTAPSMLEITEIGKVEYNGSGVAFNIDSLNWINTAPANQILAREEVTRTIYDEFNGQTVPYNSGTLASPVAATTQIQSLFGSNYAMDNTRNRIVGVVYQETYNPSMSNFESGTMYDYDPHGNVKQMIQVHNAAPLVDRNQHIKRLEYEYDLVSGNVNSVVYQKDQEDQFIHQYQYDADNRITIAETSKDGINFEKDAKYFYYDHGPLARTEIGEEKVQSSDYAYTIQGWIKAVNGEQVDENDMMGQDGNQLTLNSQVARDAYGFSLSYYDNDYTANTTTMLNYSNGANNLGASLYNGNIRSMFTSMINEDENDPASSSPVLKTHQAVYAYDQLNRIKSMEGYNRTIGQIASPSGYRSSYSFDANGNLETLKRYAFADTSSKLMDDFVYHYDDPVNSGNNNRLSWVDDLAGVSEFDNADIDNSMNAGNYVYDSIGQLLKDRDEGILNITWKVTNKVEEVQIDTDGDLAADKFIHFDYDPMGNRIAKHVIINSDTNSTFYTLDAQGNPMSMYSYQSDSSNYRLSERSLYGSSRIGVENPNEVLGFRALNASVTHTTFYSEENYTGDKNYELSNHLGNVLEVITDRKLAQKSAVDTTATDFYTCDVLAYTDYYPYGMVMPGRIKSVDEYRYRYGFGSHEKDDEVKGEGNHIAFGDYGYDIRVGRRLGLDPVIKHHISGYSAFSNNPIIFIDPNGTTDYYNIKGKWIGTDGIQNGAKQMILKRPIARIIKKATRQGNNISMNIKAYRDIIDVPSKAEITAMDGVYTRMESSQNEEGFVAGNPIGGGSKIISEPPGVENGAFNPLTGYEELQSKGATGSYDAHGHPAVLIANAKGEIAVSTSNSSPADEQTTPMYEEAFGRTQANIVLGYDTPTDRTIMPQNDIQNALNNPGKFVPLSGNYSKIITFYDSLGEIKSTLFSKFRKGAERARNHDASTSQPKKCSTN